MVGCGLFWCVGVCFLLFFFFFNDTATTEIYTLSLHDALPIYLHTIPDEPSQGSQRSRKSSANRSEEHTSELQSLRHLVCRLLLEKKKQPATWCRCCGGCGCRCCWRQSCSSRAKPSGRCPPSFFFFNDPPTPKIYTLSLHDALPI